MTKEKLDSFFEPQLCEQGTEADLDNPLYIAEPKIDGTRCIVERMPGNDEGLVIYGRRGLIYNNKIKEITQPLSQIFGFFRLDGELVYLDPEGHTIFSGCQKRLQVTNPEQIEKYSKTYPLGLFLFDIVYLNGINLMPWPYHKRRTILERFVGLQQELFGWETIRLIPTTLRTGMASRQMFELWIKNGNEGVILKKINGSYESGKRTDNWKKVKIRDHTPFVLPNNGIAKDEEV